MKTSTARTLQSSLRAVQMRAAPYPDLPVPTAFRAKAMSEIPRRPFLCGPAYQTGHVTLTIAAPGAGKTSLSIAEALHLASGQTLFEPLRSPFRVWLFNGEEPIDELERRIAGMVARYAIDAETMASNLFVNSGLDRQLAFGSRQTSEEENKAIFSALVESIVARDIEILILDPFVSTHAEQENDNSAIDYVSKLWAQVAKKAKCAVHLVHHTRKSGYEALTADSVRGASSLVATARYVRTLTPLSAGTFSELDGGGKAVKIEVAKSNNSASGAIQHFAIEPFELDNGSDGEPGDSIGVITPIDPAALRKPLVSPDDYPAIERVFTTPLRESDQTTAEWAGEALAQALGLNIAMKAPIKQRLKHLVDIGVLYRWREKGGNGNLVPWIGLKAHYEDAQATGRIAKRKR